MKKLIRKGGIAAGIVALSTLSVVMLSAFEAHVINVTAKIENALAVSTDAIDFGTVFPQEHLERPLGIRLSGSFMEEDRVDDVEYFIRQKPKCAVTAEGGTIMLDFPTATGHIVLGDDETTTGVVEEYTIDCGPAPAELPQGATWGVLPSLCEYISKEADGIPENDETLASFHHPWTIVQGDNPATTSTVETSYIDWNDTNGRLAKSDQDVEDSWTIDLAVPCFGGHCAQDWEEFVAGINPLADPDEFVQGTSNEHMIFGCDLWVEVSEVSESNGEPEPETATLTVTKVVVIDDGGNEVLGDFALTVNGSPVTSGTANVLPPGAYDVGETGVAGYEATFTVDCDADGDVTLV